jgi:hypothetical protein
MVVVFVVVAVVEVATIWPYFNQLAEVVPVGNVVEYGSREHRRTVPIGSTLNVELVSNTASPEVGVEEEHVNV